MASSIKVPLCFASCSIGLPRHTLHQKIEAIRHAGFTAIELSMPDLIFFASQHFGKDIEEDDYESLCEAGAEVGTLCESHDIQVLVLQPFSNFEGWPRESKERYEAFKKARGWMGIMDAVGTDMLQVGSSDSPGISTDFEQLAEDLRDLADLMAPKGFKIAYENWCWASQAPNWADVWKIVKMADRPNIGLCLDTFQTAGGEWADPTTESGLLPGLTETEVNTGYQESLNELSRTVPGDKIFFLQISDAYRMSPPLGANETDEGLSPRGQWSHDYRPLPYDGGYLPISQFVAAVLSTGFRGWFSMEVFDGRFEEKYGDDLTGFAMKAKMSNDRLVEEAAKHMRDSYIQFHD